MTQLLEHYFSTVSTSLTKLGVNLSKEGYSFESFYEEFRERCWEEMLTGLQFIPPLLEMGKLVEKLKNKIDDQKNKGILSEKSSFGVSGKRILCPQKKLVEEQLIESWNCSCHRLASSGRGITRKSFAV